MAGHRYDDVDSDDSFLDIPLKGNSDGTPSVDWDRIDETLAKAKRGEIKLPELPPPIEH